MLRWDLGGRRSYAMKHATRLLTGGWSLRIFRCGVWSSIPHCSCSRSLLKQLVVVVGVGAGIYCS